MKIAFDYQKEVRNLAKHGVSLVLAERLEWDFMQIKSKSGRIFDLPSDEEERRIQVGIATDEDAFTLEDFQRMHHPGQPKAAVRKEPVSLRLSPEVVAYFKSTGKGWQTRLDEVLKAYVEARYR